MNEQEQYFYFNGEVIQGKEIRISPFDRGFLFGDGIYEALRSDKGKIFLLESHLKRLQKNLKELKIDFPGFEDFNRLVQQLVAKNKFSEDPLFIYIQVTRGSYFPRQHFFPPKDTPPTVFVSVNPFKRNVKAFSKGIKIILEKDIRWTRCDIKTISILPNILARQKAQENEAGEAAFVREGYITECSHSNFFGVKNWSVYTAPLSGYILPGVTRDEVINICKRNNIPVIEKPIFLDNIDEYDEFFITGTITEITPVIQIDQMKVKEGKPGKLTLDIQNIFNKKLLG